MKKATVLLTSLLLFSSSLFAQKKPMGAFIDDLMSKMTVEEKIGQLNLMPGTDLTTGAKTNSPLVGLIEKGQLGSVLNTKGVAKIKALQEVAVKKSRLHIPLIFGLDVIHGFETVLPIPLAQACSWNPEAIEAGARMAAEEAAASGISWVYSPMVDVALDARWGRVAEGYGEDPYLSSVMGAAAVRGYQGSGEEKGYAANELMACLKHYALYGAVEAGRDYNTVDMSRLRMYNQYLPPYKAAVKAGVGSVMSSFNIVDGIPATGNRWLLTDVLRKQWGFNGFLVTDYGSINEMTSWGFGDQKTSSAQAMKAGTDMDMCSGAYTAQLKACLADGSVTMEELNKVFRKYQSNYTDVPQGPLYPFGYGLSYTTYKYSPVTLSATTIKKGSKVTATATITNTGTRDGDEIVQFYIHDRFASIVRPVKELKGFQRIHLAKGESKTVSFDIDASTLSYYDANGNTVLEPGDFDIMIGPNSRDVNSVKLTVVE